MKDRNQNPVVGDTVKLRLLAYNSNNASSLYEVDRVEVWREDCSERTCENPDGSLLVETCRDCVTEESSGVYSLGILLESPKYVIGNYHDVWYVRFREGDELAQIKQDFKVYPDLWITSPTPVVYGFSFRFNPNRMRKGSKKYLTIQIIPEVPRATDLERYYQNLAVSANLRIWIEQNCGPCLPAESDLRLVVDGDPVTERDKAFSYYRLDTCDLDCGMYDVWFEMEFAGNVEVSPRMQFQVY